MDVAPRLLAAFFQRVEQTDSCWLWTGTLNPRGYGRFNIGRNLEGKSQIRFAHRWAYETFVGPIPENKVLDHTCNVRRCVNPEHLEPTTIRQNTLNGFSRRGYQTSPTKKHAKVTDADFLRWGIKTSKRIKVVEGHWLWQGGTDPEGYGRIAVPQPGGTYKTVRAHRWFYQFFTDTPIPDTVVVDHTCRIRLCVNPEHLQTMEHGEHVSMNWAAKRETKTHCANGHVLAEVGTNAKGDCRQCNRDKVKRHREKKIAEDPEGYRAAHAARERARRKAQG